MNKKASHSLEIPLAIENFETASEYIEQWLTQNGISRALVTEIRLLFEALFQNMIAQGYDEDTILTIKLKKSFGEASITLGFEGEAYSPSHNKQDELSPEVKIVQAFNDRIGYRYRMGYNSIRIVVKRNYRSSLMQCIIGILLAILVYFPISVLLSNDTQVAIDDNFLSPLTKQFASAMLMVGAPVTFFSLVKNLTDIYIVSEKSSSSRKLQFKTLATSLFAILLALGTSFMTAFLLSSQGGLLSEREAVAGGLSATEFISTMVPSSIFEPFETYTPFPIIIVALLTTYALCSVGEYFEMMQKVINACFTLFSKMLNIIMFTLPFFCFLAILTVLLPTGFSNLFVIARFVAVVLLSLIILVIFYLVRLIIGGVKVIPFIRLLPALVWENIKINSAIDAVPFNIRYCTRKYGFNRKRISAKFPILAETNQDGNCYLIMLISMMFIFVLGIEVSWLHILGIATLVIFLSLGAPNQPGSILIGMLIITHFLQADELIIVAILAEVFFGSLQNIINVIGDIVIVAIEEQKAQRALAAD